MMTNEPATLARAARDAKRIGLFGGSFDPPHAGHIHMARAARSARALDHVLWIPAARPPHKPERVLADGATRCRMLELLIADDPFSSIYRGELVRSGPSFTIDTVRELVGRLADGVRVFLLLGSDNLAGLPRWRDAHALLELVEPIVLPRTGASVEPPELDALPPALRAKLRDGVLASERVDVSSSDVREQLGRGAPAGDALPAALARFIDERRLYTVES